MTAPSSENLLQVRNLCVNYGAVQALRGVSLDVRPGEIVTLLGSNGAGKSTLLRSIMQLVPAAKGEIQFLGRPLVGVKTNAVVKSGLALVPEGRGILQTMTVMENLELGAYHQHHWEAELEHIFTLFPRLKERLKQQAGTLSGGEQQMLALGRALLSKPKLLLLDEPSLGLAPLIIQNIFKLIAQIRTAGISILLIEQNAHMALKVADRVYLLVTGKMVVDGVPAKDFNIQETEKAYLGG